MLRNIIIVAGILLVLIGVFWPIMSRVPLFRLPGDIVIRRQGTQIHIPITSMIILSVLLSLLIRMFR